MSYMKSHPEARCECGSRALADHPQCISCTLRDISERLERARLDLSIAWQEVRALMED
jgi:hypothetical protein